MSDNLKTIAIIMARGGSKGLPKKNVKIVDNEDYCKDPNNQHEKVCQ